MEFLLGIVGLFILVAVAGAIFGFLSAWFPATDSAELPLPYKAKPYLFSRSEHEFLRILHEQLDNKRFLVFPKVRLADFIEVTVRGQEYQGWWNKIRSKHVDFLVWDVEQNKIALAIELDGKSHNSDKVRERDNFVNKLYGTIGVRLCRVAVGTNFVSEIEAIISAENKN